MVLMKTILFVPCRGLTAHFVAWKSEEGQTSCKQSEASERRRALGKCSSPLQMLARVYLGHIQSYNHTFLSYLEIKIAE